MILLTSKTQPYMEKYEKDGVVKEKVPEKIYVACDVLTEEGRAFILKHPVSYLRSVEYISTKTFIEKLECWLYEKGREYCGEFDEGFLIGFKTYKEAIEDFRKYLEIEGE